MKCPKCGQNTLTLKYQIKNIPEIGEELFLILECKNCGFTFTSVYPMKYGKPKKIVFKVETEEDLDVYVVKYRTAKLILEEVGIEITPSTLSKTTITTIEGLIDEVKTNLKNMKIFFDEEKRKQIDNIIDYLEKVGKGKKLTIIIEDMDGLSKIYSRKAKESLLQQ